MHLVIQKKLMPTSEDSLHQVARQSLLPSLLHLLLLYQPGSLAHLVKLLQLRFEMDYYLLQFVGLLRQVLWVYRE
jgi:hypothetical protein